MSIQTYKIKAFPKGKWWIRWIDHISQDEGQSSTPRIEVALEPYTLDGIHSREKDKALIKNQTERRYISIMVSSIPGLHIGAIFNDGIYVDNLFTLEQHFSATLENEGQPIAATSLKNFKPDWWNDRYPYCLINKGEYPLGKFSKSYCLEFTSGAETVILPCYELLRAFYAPSSVIALPLFSEPWTTESAINHIVQSDRTGVLANGEYQVVLRKNIKDDYRYRAAHLTLNPYGKACAEQIYSHYTNSKDGHQIKVSWPFNTPTISFKGNITILQREPSTKWLVTRITGITWPQPYPKVHFDRTNSGNIGEQQTSTNKPKPYLNVPKPNHQSLDDIPAISAGEDPESSTAPNHLATPGLLWTQLPDSEKIEKLHSFKYEGDAVANVSTDNNTSISTGKPSREQINSSKADMQQEKRRPVSNRFKEAIWMLKQLQEKKAIQSWQVFEPDKKRHYRGDYPVWPFPRLYKNIDTNEKVAINWSYLDRSDMTARCAFIASIQLHNGRTLYFIEIECRVNEGGFRSCLLYATNDNPITINVIKVILLRIAVNRGVFSSIKPFIEDNFPELNIIDFKHTYDKKTGNPSLNLISQKLSLLVNA
ncbi:hypothetical protein AB835_14795 [Candidatus Endobugula sertula]|uniref:TnsE C-terminal domain-containing protein n=1 Tax=Candidatus Endobugula sertula TaxID=62101 RepID=A0A1D2QL76_9GAMM|nr:hypothetical protein AB835_14795 [Candidatus Endobugula sertula]